MDVKYGYKTKKTYVLPKLTELQNIKAFKVINFNWSYKSSMKH